MKHGWLTNSDIAGGTESRYSAKTMVSRYTEKQNITFMGGLNNVNDRGITGRRGSRGLRTQKHAGLNISTETEKFEVEGNARYRYNKNDSQTKNSSERMIPPWARRDKHLITLRHLPKVKTVYDFMLRFVGMVDHLVVQRHEGGVAAV